MQPIVEVNNFCDWDNTRNFWPFFGWKNNFFAKNQPFLLKFSSCGELLVVQKPLTDVQTNSQCNHTICCNWMRLSGISGQNAKFTKIFSIRQTNWSQCRRRYLEHQAQIPSGACNCKRKTYSQKKDRKVHFSENFDGWSEGMEIAFWCIHQLSLEIWKMGRKGVHRCKKILTKRYCVILSNYIFTFLAKLHCSVNCEKWVRFRDFWFHCFLLTW